MCSVGSFYICPLSAESIDSHLESTQDLSAMCFSKAKKREIFRYKDECLKQPREIAGFYTLPGIIPG